ncbi:hypothetical protein ABZ353_09110 [Streptomyces niveus]|uniref:hypothetical protein n=1 Tax=Streptomyces niveus TaxID=193462 RepID=UPI0033DBCD66
MSLRVRIPVPLRARWQRVVSLLGCVLNLWGNSLYDTSHRALSLTLFFGGLGLVFLTRRSWDGVTDSWPALQRARGWADRKREEPKWRHLWERLKLAVWGVVVAGVVLYAWTLLIKITLEPDRVAEHFGSGMTFMTVWGLLPLLAQFAEPKDPPKQELLERMSARIGRAVINRQVANAAGIYFAGVLVYTLVFDSRPLLIVPAAVTLGGATIATAHKTWTRLRKLSTQLYSNIRTLERDLAVISKAEDLRGKQDAARRSWDAVELDLGTSVDTGYNLLGTPFLPPEVTDDLRERVETAIEELNDDATAAKEVLDDLSKIREACLGRLDSVA